VARYDKYDGKTGGFRAPLAADWGADRVGVPTAVGLNADGRLVPGAANSGVAGVLVIDHPFNAGDVVDTMTSGEIVDCDGLAAGTTYFASDADGTLGTVAAVTKVGHTVEAQRLVVRVNRTGA